MRGSPSNHQPWKICAASLSVGKQQNKIWQRTLAERALWYILHWNGKNVAETSNTKTLLSNLEDTITNLSRTIKLPRMAGRLRYEHTIDLSFQIYSNATAITVRCLTLSNQQSRKMCAASLSAGKQQNKIWQSTLAKRSLWYIYCT
jgi:hypothetical protein